MKKELFIYLKLIIGLFLSSLGTVIILNSGLGLSPWNVLHQGINIMFEITLGQANILVGFVFVVITLLYKQPIGPGTILNFILLGIFIDLIMFIDILPIPNNFIESFITLIIGIAIFSFGGFAYISTGLGCGPRDGIIVVIAKKTNFSLAQIKICIEVSALSIGYLFGGTVGIGTVASSLLSGPFMQKFFKLSGKDIKEIKHKSLITEVLKLKNWILSI